MLFFTFFAVRTDLARGFVTCGLQLIETIPWPLENKRLKSKYKSIFDVSFFCLLTFSRLEFLKWTYSMKASMPYLAEGKNNILMKSSLALVVGYFFDMATYRNISGLLNHVIIIML